MKTKKKKYTDMDVSNAVVFGLGYVTGKHNLPDIPVEKRKEIAESFITVLNSSKLTNPF